MKFLYYSLYVKYVQLLYPKFQINLCVEMSKNIYNSYFKFLAFFKKVDFAAATNLHFMQLLQFQVLYFNYLYVPNTYSFIIELRNWEIVILSPSPKDVKHFIFKCMQDLCNIRSL